METFSSVTLLEMMPSVTAFMTLGLEMVVFVSILFGEVDNSFLEAVGSELMEGLEIARGFWAIEGSETNKDLEMLEMLLL